MPIYPIRPKVRPKNGLGCLHQLTWPIDKFRQHLIRLIGHSLRAFVLARLEQEWRGQNVLVFTEFIMTSSLKSLQPNRRVFMLQAAVATGTLATVCAAQAQALSETDAQAAALGYKADGSKVDKAKYPKYAAGQACGNCAVFIGKAGDAAGGCSIFAGKQVSSKGWCNAYVKKG